MNGPHDMGGHQTMGSVPYEKDEPVFHARWESRIYALNRCIRAQRLWNQNTDRYDVERIPPAEYLRMSYYERWLYRLERQVVEHKLATPEELKSGHAAPGSPKATPAITGAMRTRMLSRNIPSSIDSTVRPSFRVNDRIRTRNMHPAGHTRLPWYARGKRGVITRDHGVYVFPDTMAHGLGEKKQHLYAVRFAAQELWGPQASRVDTVCLDLFDDYLERA